MARTTITRAEALKRLARLGISGSDVYLLDVIPLFEMAWADGEVQPSERSMILAFLEDHLARLEAMRQGTLVTRLDALRFVDRFLDQKPPPGLLRELRDLLTVVRLTAPDGSHATQRILDGAMAVGGVAPSPHRPGADWDERELEVLWDIEDSLRQR